MSFSDFGRSAISGLSPTAPTPPSGVSKRRNVRRSSDPLPPRSGSDGRRRSKNNREVGVSKPSAIGSKSSQRRRSDGCAIANRRRDGTNSLEIQRGVRPKLDHIQCPVSQKRIMDDVLTVQGDESRIGDSLASTSYSSSIPSQDSSNDSGDSDTYSESDIGLNHTDNSRTEIRQRQRRSNKSRSTSQLDGRKSRRRETGGSSHLLTSPPRQSRRLPKHYNNVSGPEVREQSSHKHSQKHQDLDFKIPDKKQNKSTNRHQNKTSGSGLLPHDTTIIGSHKKTTASMPMK